MRKSEIVNISAVIITFNEEANIVDAIRSVEWADEVLVVDSNSTDRTREIAAELGARVIAHDWPGFAAQKQFATDEAENDVIFSLDADERVSDGLKDEILAIKELDFLPFDGYKIPRLPIYMGREIRHGAWYPDRQLRLFDRRKGHWKQVVIHESVEMNAEATLGILKHDLIHHTVDTADEHARMIEERYAPLGARAMFERGQRTSALRTAVAGPAAFVRDYLLKAGFLDGYAGFCIARFSARHATMKHKLLKDMQNGRNSPLTGRGE